jgi:hypothetical protein
MYARPWIPSRPGPLWRAILAMALALPLTAALPQRVAGQAAEPVSIVGTWSVAFPNDDPTTRQLMSFLSDGVVLATNAPTFVADMETGERIYSSAGHGAWVNLDDGRYAFTLVFLYFEDDEDNWGSLTIDGVVTLDPSGDRFEGSFTVTVAAETGMPLFIGEADDSQPITGARVRVRPAG